MVLFCVVVALMAAIAYRLTLEVVSYLQVMSCHVMSCRVELQLFPWCVDIAPVIRELRIKTAWRQGRARSFKRTLSRGVGMGHEVTDGEGCGCRQQKGDEPCLISAPHPTIGSDQPLHGIAMRVVPLPLPVQHQPNPAKRLPRCLSVRPARPRPMPKVRILKAEESSRRQLTIISKANILAVGLHKSPSGPRKQNVKGKKATSSHEARSKILP